MHRTNQQPYRYLPLICALLVTWAILVLGVDIWFRNEAGTHLRWFQEHPGFWEALKFPGLINHYRPVSFLMLSAINQLFGQAALPYVLANFVGFLFTLVCYYLLVRQNTDDTVAYFSLMALFPLFNHILYYPFNALHGIFYSWDVGWFCLAFYLYIQGIRNPEHRIRNLVLSVLFSLIALGTHAFAGLTLAVMIFALLVAHFRVYAKNISLIIVGIAIPVLLVMLIPLLEPGGERIFSPETTLLQYITGRIELMARIIMFPRIALILFVGMVQVVVHRLVKHQFSSPLWAIAAGIFVIIFMNAIPNGISQTVLLILTVLLLLYVLFFVPYYRIFALMALLGLAHYMLVRSESSNYLRYFIFGITPIIMFGIFTVGKNLLIWTRIPRPKESHLSVWTIVITIIACVGIVLGTLDMPKVREPVRRIRYLCHLSQTFHDALFQGTTSIPQNSCVHFYSGHEPQEAAKTPDYVSTQAGEKSALYTQSHLNRLLPAKPYEYVSYFAITDRSDLKLGYIEDGISPHPGQSLYLFAFNKVELKRIRIEIPTARLIFHSKRGRAEAAIFELPAQESEPENHMISTDR